MGVSDASVPLKKTSNFTPANQHYISFDSSKILSNQKLSKNLKEILSANKDKKNTSKLQIINSNNCFNEANNTTKNNNLINYQNKKVSFLKSTNVSKTVDKKLTNSNINKSIFNDSNNNSNTNTNANSSNKKNFSYLKENSKKYLKLKEKNVNNNIKNININNNSNKDVIPFYYKPKRILTQKASKATKDHNNKNNSNYFNNIIDKENNMIKTKSKDNFTSKHIFNSNNLNNMTGIDIHRSFNNISRISSNDKFNLVNNSSIKKKINYQNENITDIHNYFNENKNKPLYLIDDITNHLICKKNEKHFSNENDFNQVIRHNKDNSNKLKICIELLKLKERKWQEEIVNISKLISYNRMPKNNIHHINLNYILQKIVLLYDNFNWLINSLGYVYNSFVYENKKEILNNYGAGILDLPSFNSNIWLKGFKWKGLYIRLDKNINCINNIKKEIKSLNYFFFDYLHIIWNDNNKIIEDSDANNNILSNNIIFPLIGYCKINSFILIVSAIIRPEKNNNININDIVKQSKGIIELNSKINNGENNIWGNKIKTNKYPGKYHYKDNIKKINNNFYNININDFNKNKYMTNKINSSIDFNNNKNKNSNNTTKNESNIKNNNNINNNINDITYFKDSFFINDLLKSKLFTGMSKNNLIKVKGGKFVLVDVSKLVPKLFENNFCNDIKKVNFFGEVNGEKKYYTLNYNSLFNINIDNILNINIYSSNKNSENNKINLNENFNNNTPKYILEKVYNIFPSSNMKYKNIKIGNIFFRILFFNSQQSKINSKKSFVDILFNYNEVRQNKTLLDILNSNEDLNEIENQEITHIQEPYVIIYDIIEPIKLDYSLIQSIKMKDNQTEVIKNIFFLRTNYVEYFLNWCEIFNKNSYNIKRYQDLKYFMKKYGINQNLLFFSLIKINNKEITDIIKIHLLVKAFKFICFQHDNEIVLNEIKKRQKNEANKEMNLSENLKSKIIFYIKSIIYPNEILPIGQKKFKYIYEQLLFFSNILFFRYKLIDDYLSLGLLNNDDIKNNSLYSFFNIQSPYEFLKHIILIARKKPFLFISEMEAKINFVIDPFVKFKCSISIESMSHQLDVVHVNLLNTKVISFIEPEDISGLILTKIIKKFKEKEDNNENENRNINTVFINNTYRYSEKTKIFMNKDKDIETKINKFNSKNDDNTNSINDMSDAPNPKENTLKIKNNIIRNNKINNSNYSNNNMNDKKNHNDLEKEEKKSIFENESENNKNDDNKSNISIINFNTNNNSKILLRNNSHENNNHNNYSNDINNIDNNEIVTKITNDKTMDESETTKTQISNAGTNLESNSANNLPHYKNHCKNNCNSSENINLKNLKDIYESIIFLLPPNCYKILYNYEINNKNKILFQNIEQFYIIKNFQIIKEWANNNENIFKTIFNSYNGDCEYSLIKSYIFYFLFSFYIEKNRKEAYKANNKLLSLFKNNFSYQLTLNDLAIINLLQAISSNNYIENEEYFSKCVMLLLINYGDPRGRNNDSHGAMQFPLWEISRKTYKLEEPFVNENFKEMYQALDFFDKKKGIFNLAKNKNENIYGFNYIYNIIKNYEKLKLMNINIKYNKNMKNIIEMNDSESIYSMVNNIDENPNENYINKDLTDKDISLSLSIFEKNVLEKSCIKHNIFPSISCKSLNVNKVFYRKEFVIYLIKEIQSLLMGRGISLNKIFIDKKISEDIIIIKDANNNSLNKGKLRENSTNKINETPLKEKYINNYDREKQLVNSSSKTNPYLEIEKKINNNRNNQYLARNNHLFNTANTSKSYNNSVSTSNDVNSTNRNNNNKNKNSSSFNNNKINNRKTISNNDHNHNPNNISSNKKPKKIFSHFLYIELLQKLSYKKNLPNGIIISFGNNRHNETSHDRYEKLTLPRVIFKLKNEMIKTISSGWQHNIVVNNKGEMFSFGHNQEFQCGLPNHEKANSNNCENINDPTNISVIYKNLKAIKVSCGNEHSLILSQDKNVYGVGNNEDGLLCLPENELKTYKPVKINFIVNNKENNIENNNEKKIEYNGKIVDISCGTVHNLALTEDGNVFSWGSFQGGQLGLSSDILMTKDNKKNNEKKLFLSSPTLIPYFSKNKIKIEKISGGEAHSLALSDKGKVYSWGFGSNGQLGLGFCEDSFEPGQGLLQSRRFEPQLIKTFKDYNNYNNTFNQRNKNINNNNNTCNNIKIKEIECGKTFSMFINSTNNLYACGINDLRQLGFKDPEPRNDLFNPTIQCDDYIYPSLLKCFENKKVEFISCGEGHCLAIVNDINNNRQSIWSWGNNKFGQLGHGSIIKISIPKEIEYLSEFNMNKFSQVSCGGFHSLCLLKSKNNLEWIEKDYNESILEIIEEIGEL